MDGGKAISRKVIVVGNSGVGKTALVLRFVQDSYTEDLAGTIGGEAARPAQIYTPWPRPCSCSHPPRPPKILGGPAVTIAVVASDQSTGQSNRGCFPLQDLLSPRPSCSETKRACAPSTSRSGTPRAKSAFDPWLLPTQFVLISCLNQRSLLLVPALAPTPGSKLSALDAAGPHLLPWRISSDSLLRQLRPQGHRTRPHPAPPLTHTRAAPPRYYLLKL